MHLIQPLVYSTLSRQNLMLRELIIGQGHAGPKVQRQDSEAMLPPWTPWLSPEASPALFSAGKPTPHFLSPASQCTAFYLSTLPAGCHPSPWHPGTRLEFFFLPSLSLVTTLSVFLLSHCLHSRPLYSESLWNPWHLSFFPMSPTLRSRKVSSSTKDFCCHFWL